MSTDAIRLPVERADQLRTLAALKDMTVADLIGHLVCEEAERLGFAEKIGLGDTVEAVALEDGSIHFCATPIGIHHWSRETTVGVAAAIERALKREGSTFDVDAGIETKRVGTSVKIRDTATGEERAFAPSIAAELASLLRSTAAATV